MSSQGHTVRLGQLEIFAEETGKGSPTLVFIHYWGGSRRTWSEVVARLSKRFRCIALDVRGWGKSDRHADDYSLFAQADDVQGVIAALNVKDVVLVGHSMGGTPRSWVAGDRKACGRSYSWPLRHRRPFTSRTSRSNRCSPATPRLRASGKRSKSLAIGH